ncbi:phage baseplate assembly protein V [Pelosinus sp. UFO1]|uniref:phage baseplate assembly protein V n=1 Tax=Pelosinus sp. UFO1 TaxID=484770 RepID=UPI0004D0F329|nr:phage baseplate assembly protein V [Pelosinus sp. UFO1]AIF51262.1 phage baseplate assembly protein V [Pelosinus sp. UFO1]
MNGNDIKNLFRTGTVTAIDEVKQLIRVTFDDLDDTVSPWMQVAARGVSKDDDYWVPDIDEQVQCMFMPTGNAEGYVLFSVRGANNVPRAGKMGRRYIKFADGSSVEHDRESSTMTIVCSGPINIIAAGNVNVTGDVIANGVSLINHIHPESIGTVTGKPQ